jgi:hypothetical protein
MLHSLLWLATQWVWLLVPAYKSFCAVKERDSAAVTRWLKYWVAATAAAAIDLVPAVLLAW